MYIYLSLYNVHSKRNKNFQLISDDYGSIHSVIDTSTQGHQAPFSEETDSLGKVQGAAILGLVNLAQGEVRPRKLGQVKLDQGISSPSLDFVQENLVQLVLYPSTKLGQAGT